MSQTRRTFLQSAGASFALPWLIPASALGADGEQAPSNRINLAIIGCGHMCRVHLPTLLWYHDRARIVAVCDVDCRRREDVKGIVEANYVQSLAGGSYRGCAAVNDFREVLARPDVDAVLIITPDHWHTPIAIAAAQAHKDIYCEKPVSHCLAEGRALVRAVQENHVVFQNGSHYRSMQSMRPVLNFIRKGGLGKISEVFALWRKDIHLPVLGTASSWDIPESAKDLPHFFIPQFTAVPAEPVPAGLDWNLWVGPAPMRGYSRFYHEASWDHVVPWNWCADFGTGIPTYSYSHEAEMAQYALGCETGGPIEIVHPRDNRFPTLTNRYANGANLHLLATWAEGRRCYPAFPAAFRLASPDRGIFGAIYVGERGWIAAHKDGGIQGTEAILRELGLQPGAPFSTRNDHHENWFDCIKSRAKPSSHEEIGHRAAAAGHLVNLCYRLGRTLRWNPAAETFLGDDEANRMRTKAYRHF